MFFIPCTLVHNVLCFKWLKWLFNNNFFQDLAAREKGSFLGYFFVRQLREYEQLLWSLCDFLFFCLSVFILKIIFLYAFLALRFIGCRFVWIAFPECFYCADLFVCWWVFFYLYLGFGICRVFIFISLF